MSGFVPPSTPVKSNRVRNVDTDRLRNRRAFLLANFTAPDSCHEFAYRMRELRVIEDTLCDRQALPTNERRTHHGAHP